MSKELPAQSLSFVWQPQYFNSFVAELSQQTDTEIILDISELSFSQLKKDFQGLNEIELKLSLEQFFSSSLKNLLKAAQTKTIWVEYFQELSSYGLDDFLQRLSYHNQINCNVITGDLDFIHSCFEKKHHIYGLAIKGSESSGFVSSETLLTFLSHLEKLALNHSFQPPIHVWGGVATPEGAVACLASGVSRVIFESVHCLTDKMIGQNDSRSKKISQLRIDHSSLVELETNLCFRVFDKGNSPAVKKLRQLVGDNKNDNGLNTENEPVAFITSETVSPLQADFDGQQIVPLGPETAFADSFVKRFGQETSMAFADFTTETTRLYADRHKALPEMLKGRITEVMGIQYPFIQGAMACISDVPDFALSIAQAGGLPTIALGIKSITEIEEELSSLHQKLNGHPYAVNIITLPENPHRHDQLSWLEKSKPPFVVISAGDPAHAASLQKKSIEIIYVTSDIDLMQLAWNSGIRFVICEGHEAGGHVGVHSTLTLAQAVLDLKRQYGTDDTEKFFILAGGIFNTNSLARAALLGADAVQMGTLYLSSQEIVSSGALSSLYQQTVINSSFGKTMLTGESVGLRVRSLSSPKIEKIRSLEEKVNRKATNETDIRHQLEETSIGSLLIAARGRHPKGGEKLSQDVCYQEGQFMSGAVAGDIQNVLSVAEIHYLLANQEFQTILPHSAQQKKNQGKRRTRRQSKKRIAVTGMAAVNSLGNNPEEIWQACLELKSGITEVPAGKWDHSKIYTPDSNAEGKTYCNVGAFLSLDILRKELGIPPHDFRTMSESTKLTLWLAHKAIHDSTLLSSDISRHRIGVLVSQNAGEIGSTLCDLTISSEAENIADSIRQSFNLTPKHDESLEHAIRSDRLTIDDTTLLGRLNCAAGGFICNKYGFTGPSYAVTSACASSLTALYSAIQMIQNGVLDAAIVGGGEELIIKASFLEFSALGALAGKGYYNEDPATFSRPFEAERSGMVLGEGGGLIVIERESVARERGAHILAYITGAGASNNHLGMVESVAQTQKIAINSSFEDAGYTPDQVDMVECHATATQLGDKEEVEALKEIFPENSSVVLSSFKSQIGHTLGASGINSLIRGICAMRAGTYPPTLNYDNPDPAIGLETAGFRVCTEPEKWPYSNHRPRRFQVNSFGFGGANYVVQMEEADWSVSQGNDAIPTTPLTDQSAGSKTNWNLDDSGVSFFKSTVDGKNFRIASVNKELNTSDIGDKLRPYLTKSEPLTKEQKRNFKKLGLSLSDNSSPPPMALVFTGQGTYYPQMGKELYENFETIRHWMDTIAQHTEFDILELLFHEEKDKLRRTIWQQPALFILEYAIYQQLKSMGIKPTALAGHSTGELTALCAADCFSYQDAIKITSKRARLMEKAGKKAKDPGSMIAVDAPREFLNKKIDEETNLYFTNFNSPHQTVIGGGTQEVKQLKTKLDSAGYWSTILPVSMVFHSPIMKTVLDEFRDFLKTIDIKKPQLPVISNTTRLPFPDEPSRIIDIIVSHLESPVHWQDNVKSLWKEYGVRFFVEIGPRNTLSNLIRDITPEAQCINSCYPEKEADTLLQAIGSLYTAGHINPPSIIELTGLADINPVYAPSPEDSREKDIRNIIKEEIYSYAMHGFDKYLKPVIIKAVQQHADPHFNEQKLTSYLPESFNPGFTAVTEAPSMTVSDSKDNIVLEQVIRIIMDATGYDRNEIEPEMDIRQDLAIKSSRIPIIIDAAERTFNITTTLEDFLAVRTVEDLAAGVLKLMHGEEFQVPTETAPIDNSIISSTPDNLSTVSSPGQAINRMVYRKTELTPDLQTPLEIDAESRILLLSLTSENHSTQVSDYFKNAYHSEVIPLQINKDQQGNNFIDLFDPDETIRKIEEISTEGSLTGVVLISDSQTEERLGLQKINSLIAGFFILFQHFLKSGNRNFFTHFHIINKDVQTESLLSQSLLGLFLTADYEYKDLCLRGMTILDSSDPASLLPIVLNRANPVIELIYQDNRLYTQKIVKQSVPATDQPTLTLSGDDVIVISGGGRGVTSYLARSLAPFGCTLILLGRSTLEPIISLDEIIDYDNDRDFVSSYLQQNFDNLPAEELETKRIRILKTLEIQKNLAEIEQLGAKVRYFSCDVADEKQVYALIDTISEKYGRVDGIIHGAGIVKDSYIPLITSRMFKEVMDVKLLGAIHLLHAAQDKGLRFVMALSSISAVSGNPGQANYCMANRAMAAFCRSAGSRYQSIITKVFWLPPIEGTGMADIEEIKDIIKQNMGSDIFLEVHEASEIMIKELLSGPPEDCWITPIRSFPETKTVMIEPAHHDQHWFNQDRLPMIDSVKALDFHRKTVHGYRRISHDRDLWLNDHKPSKSLKHPIMSAIMAIEAFLEAGHILFPHLQVTGLKKVRFLDMVECPPDTDTEIHLIGHGETTSKNQHTCIVQLKKMITSLAEESVKQMETCFMGQVVFVPTRPSLGRHEFEHVGDTDLLSENEISQLYSKHSDLINRYQVLHSIKACVSDNIQGKMLYPAVNDFAQPLASIFQYPHYLLEALMQMTFFFVGIRNKDETRAMIPAEISTISFSRNCSSGEELFLDGQLQFEDETGITWNVTGTDRKGFIIMQVDGLQMKWIG